VIDHEDFDRRLDRLEFYSELLLKRGPNRRKTVAFPGLEL
jgi:hypothetical protein